MSLGSFANQVRAEAINIQGRYSYSYPNLLTGNMGPVEYNSNSFYSTIYSRILGATPALTSKGSYIFPGAQNIIPPRR